MLYFYWLPPMPSTQVKREIGVEHKVRCGMPGCQADYCTIVEGWSRREIDVEQILTQLSGERFEYTWVLVVVKCTGVRGCRKCDFRWSCLAHRWCGQGHCKQDKLYSQGLTRPGVNLLDFGLWTQFGSRMSKVSKKCVKICTHGGIDWKKAEISEESVKDISLLLTAKMDLQIFTSWIILPVILLYV